MAGVNGQVKDLAGGDPIPSMFQRLRDRAKAAEASGGVPKSLAESLVERMDGPAEGPSIVDRLARKFGWGQNRPKRMELYQRVQRCIERHGERAYQIVSEVVAESMGSKDRAKYFCYVVVRRLRENGFATHGAHGEDVSW